MNKYLQRKFQFIERIERHFGERRRELLERRKIVQEELNQGKLPDFLEETKIFVKVIGRLRPPE